LWNDEQTQPTNGGLAGRVQTQPTNGGLATNNKYKKFKDSNEAGFQQMNDGRWAKTASRRRLGMTAKYER
jgi:hypothetical protein